MLEKIDELEKIIALCRKNGVREIEIQGLKLSLDGSALFPESAYKKKLKEQEIEKAKPDPTVQADMELLWSSFDGTSQ